MSIFQDVTFGFKGDEYKVKANKIMRLIAMVEDIVTLQDLSSGKIKMSRLAEAYAACLNYAGADVELEEVYESLFGDGGANSMQASITSLVMLILPPSTYNPPEEEAAKKKPVSRAKKKA
jgi:hypothetical protein